MKKCLKCNGELKVFSLNKDAKEKYLKCLDCGAVHANVNVPLYPKNKFLHANH